MDYATLPPEINSARMYAGPGAAPMLAAATAWDGLAAELSRAASNYGIVIADTTSGPWRGPASVSMGVAAARYVAWLGTTAAQAGRSATQAKAAAAAYEAAFAMTVPPLVIAANRVRLAALVATNLLGQNTPAIAATEAEYAEMWAQDAAAMYGYASSSAAASTLTPFTGPPPTVSDDAGAPARAAGAATATQATLTRLMSELPTALQGLAGPGLGGTAPAATLTEMEAWAGLGGTDLSSPAGILDFLAGTDGSSVGAFLNDNGLNTLFSSGFYMPGNFLGTMTDFVGMQGAGATTDAATNAATNAAAAGDAAGAATGDLGNAVGGLGRAVSAGVGNAPAIGPLSVPPSWTATGPIGGAASALSPNGVATPGVGEGLSSMMGGMPLVSPQARGLADVPRYGFRPNIVVHPPAAG
ncbi:hypothetical protein A5660_01125 [Mycobacterium alsense]|uniref:PPE family protein n=1 Tax=Mycobacterium alsense TaxID=324058 RepID=UPI0007FF58CF|nr:PPE family protein [Mycobacterium alsense]OBI95077.1 hypothetical protein A5660_01125 [Mycobacterium alsense]